MRNIKYNINYIGMNIYRIFDKYYINDSLIGKKKNIKTINILFLKKLYQALFKNHFQRKIHDIELYEIYQLYIELIDTALTFNKEELDKDFILYFKKIQLDYLHHVFYTPEYSFIYLEKEDHKEVLRKFINEIWDYSFIDDYYTLKEFEQTLHDFNYFIKKNNYKISKKDMINNIGKKPKRLLKLNKEKRKKYGKCEY